MCQRASHTSRLPRKSKRLPELHDAADSGTGPIFRGHRMSAAVADYGHSRAKRICKEIGNFGLARSQARRHQSKHLAVKLVAGSKKGYRSSGVQTFARAQLPSQTSQKTKARKNHLFSPPVGFQGRSSRPIGLGGEKEISQHVLLGSHFLSSVCKAFVRPRFRWTIFRGVRSSWQLFSVSDSQLYAQVTSACGRPLHHFHEPQKCN